MARARDFECTKERGGGTRSAASRAEAAPTARPARITCAAALLSAVSLGALLVSMPTARADNNIDSAVTVTGESWDLGTGYLRVGYEATGTLTISDEGTVISGVGYIGVYSGSTGIVTLTGQNSSWSTNGYSLYVGENGTGTLTISEGGTVTSGNSNIGHYSGSTGIVTVTGASSSWNVVGNSVGTSNLLFVGYYGTGTLTISEGGTVTSGNSYVGVYSGSTGIVTVTGESSSWKLVGTSNLYVGYYGTGTLTISEGGTVTSGISSVGHYANSVGTVTVTGAGSSWDVTSGFYVGYAGTGTLTIEDGGQVTSGVVIVAKSAGSSGTLNLNGTASGRGVLTTGKVTAGSGTAQLNFNGGVLQASADSDNFLSGFTADTVEILAGGAYIDSNGHNITIATALDGVGGLTKQGEGTLTLTGTNIYTGATVISAGTLALSGSGSIDKSSAVTVDGTLDISGVDSGTSINNLSGAGYVVLGNQALTVVESSDLTFSGVISGSGSLTKQGASTLTLTGINTYTGGTELEAGILEVSSDANLGDASGSLTFTGGTLATTATFTSARSVSLESAGGTLSTASGTILTLSGVISGSGDLTKEGEGTLTLTGANTYSGGTVISAGTLALSGSGSIAASNAVTVDGTLDISATTSVVSINNLSGTGTVALGNQALTVVQSTDLTFSGVITGTGSLTKSSSGTLILSGTNTYSGGTIINAGTLSVSSDENLGNASGSLTFTGGTLATTATFTSARSVVLESAGTIDTATDTTLTLSGILSGTGSLTKSGSGTLILSGTNTYSGGTFINAGTLSVSSDENLGDASGSLTFTGGTLATTATFTSARSVVLESAGGTIDTATDTTLTLSGILSGTGSLTKEGEGTLTLSGNSSGFTGATSVAAGTLEISGILGGTVSVASGATLTGNGSVGTLTILDGGTIAPGNSIGTLTVVGNYTQSSGSTYEVQLGASSSSDLIAVEGSATIAGTVVVTAVTGTYTVGTRYTILTATGGVSGTYNDISGSALSYFAALGLNYDETAVYLDVYQARSFASAAVTPNQTAAATALNTLASDNEIFSTILALQSAETAAGAFDALSGEVYASANTVIQQQSIYVRDAVGARLRQSVTGPAAAPLAYANAGPATAQLGVGLTPTLWAQGYGGWGNTFGNGNAASLSNTIGGFLIGADVSVADNARAGVFGGFSQSTFDVNARASSGTMDNYDVGVYAGAQFGAMAARGGLAYAWHDVSVDRTISFSDFLQAASGDYSTGSTQLFGELGYDTKLGSFDVEPFVGLAYLNIAGAAFQESGGSAALSVNVGSMDTIYTTLGVRAAASVDLFGHALTPSVTLGWQHAFGDTSPTASMLFSGGTLPFQVSGVPIAEDTFLLEAGLGYALSNQAALSVSYSGQFADTAAQNAVTARFSMKF